MQALDTSVDSDASAKSRFEGVAVHGLIPHRGDILFATSVTVLADDQFEGTACWTDQQAGLAGHFPGAPIVPAIFLVEAAAQIVGAGLAAVHREKRGSAQQGQVGVMAGIRRCNFSRPVFPGQVVRFELRLGRATADFASCSGSFSVDGSTAGSLEFVVAMADARTLFEVSPVKDH